MAEREDARPQKTPSQSRRPTWLGWALTGAGVVGCGVLLALVMYGPPPNGDASSTAEPQGGKSTALFAGWGKPDVAIIITGEMHGYLQPCGCSEPQYGGMARRYNFLQTLRKMGWPLVEVDLGDIAQKHPSGQQAKWKYATAMESLKAMGYSAIGIGKHEFQGPLVDLLAEFTLQQPDPMTATPRVLAANLSENFNGLIGDAIVPKQPATPRVGIFSLVAPSVAKTVRDPAIKFMVDKQNKYDNVTAIKKSLDKLKEQKSDFAVLLYMGSSHEAQACAKYCNTLKGGPAVRVIVCMSDDPEPPSAPQVVGNVQLIWVGHKGKYVGVLGGYRTNQPNQPWAWKYQPVKMGPEFNTPVGEEKAHPVMQLMERYARQVKAAKLVENFIQVDHPVQQAFKGVKPKYVGSKRCQDCHPSAYKVWEKTYNEHGHIKGHAIAFKSLEESKNPSERQYDPECVACHVVGFGKTAGYTDPTNTGRLKNVGCESCHGPCSEHVKDPTDAKWYPHINPLRAGDRERQLAAKQAKSALTKDELADLKQLSGRRLNSIDRFCQSCHDIENDVHWKFDQKWPKIIHLTPAAERQKRNQNAVQIQEAPPRPMLIAPGKKN